MGDCSHFTLSFSTGLIVPHQFLVAYHAQNESSALLDSSHCTPEYVGTAEHRPFFQANQTKNYLCFRCPVLCNFRHLRSAPTQVVTRTIGPEDNENSPELSIVMPCLNEADTLATCITKALQALKAHKIAGEIIIADNGSTDGCQAIALRLGARLVCVRNRGYGNALMEGIAAARGKFVVMGDADDSYDFLGVPKLLEKLCEGFDLAQGCRLPSGGGTIIGNGVRYGDDYYGWRTLRLFLTCSPRWLLLVPGILLILLGIIGYGIAMPGITFYA